MARPLVTATAKGKGWLVLVHTTSGPDWSNLALSGLYADMLRRMSALSAGVADEAGKSGSLAPISILDGLGVLHDAPPTALPIEIAKFDKTDIDPAHPPGYYGSGGARRALNLSQAIGTITALPAFAGLKVATYQAPIERSIAPFLLALGLLMLAIDTVIGLWLKGLLGKRIHAVLAVGLLLTLPAHADTNRQDDARRHRYDAWLCPHRG